MTARWINTNPKDTITNKKDFVISCVIFACAVVMLVTHAQTGLTVALIGAVIAVVTLITSGRYALEILKRWITRHCYFLLVCLLL